LGRALLAGGWLLAGWEAIPLKRLYDWTVFAASSQKSRSAVVWTVSLCVFGALSLLAAEEWMRWNYFPKLETQPPIADPIAVAPLVAPRMPK